MRALLRVTIEGHSYTLCASENLPCGRCDYAWYEGRTFVQNASAFERALLATVLQLRARVVENACADGGPRDCQWCSQAFCELRHMERELLVVCSTKEFEMANPPAKKSKQAKPAPAPKTKAKAKKSGRKECKGR